MYDIILRNDLLNFMKAENIDTIKYNRNEMQKIIKCRTRDKIDLVNFLLLYNAIDNECYKELLERTKSDFRKANLYLMGLCSSLE